MRDAFRGPAQNARASKCKPAALVAVLVLVALALAGSRTPGRADTSNTPPTPDAYFHGPQNSYPNPYRTIDHWAKLPAGRKFGQTTGIDIDRAGHVWISERCGGNTCEGSRDNPVLEFDSTGKLIRSFGAGMFIYPHGVGVDKDNNVWVTDGLAADGKSGHEVIKFSPTGKVLMTLGKAGIPGDGPDTFNAPSDVIVAPNGNVFVADGHGGNTNAHIVKFTRDGKFIKAWGMHGSGPGEFDTPHGLAFDSQGRLFVADRGNSRIQIFDQDGNFIAQWRQFGRAGGLFIDKHDVLYVADSESNNARNPGFQRGIRIGSAKDGKVFAFIPDPNTDPNYTATSAAEGVAADSSGNVYGAEVGLMDVKKYVKK